MGRTAAAARRGRATGQGKQVHHAACAALGTAGNPAVAARQRIPDHHSARGLDRSGRSACRMPRECVLGDAREPEEGRRQRAAGAAGREDAGVMPMQMLDWQQLDAAGRTAALARPAAVFQRSTLQQAQAIIDAVRSTGAAAVRRYALEFDGIAPDELRVSPAEFAAARAELTADQVAALERAIANVDSFHRAGAPAARSLEVQPGVRCERLIRPIAAVGLYVPAGSAPLPSTVIMLAVPARIAGCARRVLCTPPQRSGLANAAVLLAAQLCGIEQVFKIGGAQAIAAMAYGTR